MIDYEREVFCECGSWANFHELEESLSLDELLCLYEATMNRQSRAIKAASAAWGGSSGDHEEPSYSRRLRDNANGNDSKRPNKKYTPPWLIDPARGGEVTPVFGNNEAKSLPINLGYSIIDDNDE